VISRKVLFVLIAIVALSVGVVLVQLLSQARFTEGNAPSVTPSPLTEESFQFDGLMRTYLLHVPSSYDGKASVPLVIVLHGFPGLAAAKAPNSEAEAAGIAATTGFTEKSDKEGFIVVYPQGIAAQWHVGFGFFKGDVDDVGFINELISRLEQRYAIDPKRIYVVGFSNGAMMAYLVGAELSDKIAAIAPVAGTIGTVMDNTSEQIPEPSQPLSVIVFHGTADTSVPYEGGGYWGFISVTNSVIFWVRHDGCGMTPENETISYGKVIKIIYTGGINGTEVVLYTIIDGTHTWPITPISATDIIWDFFTSHPKK
jgi:polyhydroxybutyrate depolymerase